MLERHATADVLGEAAGRAEVYERRIEVSRLVEPKCLSHEHVNDLRRDQLRQCLRIPSKFGVRIGGEANPRRLQFLGNIT